jgi:hypothetical protein
MRHEVIEVVVRIIILTTEVDGLIVYVVIAINTALEASHNIEVIGEFELGNGKFESEVVAAPLHEV